MAPGAGFSPEAVPSSPGSLPFSPTKKVKNWISKLPERLSPRKSPRKPALAKPTSTKPRIENEEIKHERAPLSPLAVRQLSIGSLAANLVELEEEQALPPRYRDQIWSLDMPIPYEQVDAEDVDYRDIMAVIKSWSQLTSQPDWQKKAGTAMLRKLFELDADFRVQYGFGIDCDWNDATVYKDPRFEAKGVSLISMLDKAIDSLGPDLEPLEVELQTLGRRHILMEALPEHWVCIGHALLHAVEQSLGEDFTPSDKESWSMVYNFMAYNMVIGLVTELAERCED
jgi:hypothetical protein